MFVTRCNDGGMSAGADNRMRTLWRAERLDYSNPLRITQRVYTTRAVMCSQPHPVRTADRTVRNCCCSAELAARGLVVSHSQHALEPITTTAYFAMCPVTYLPDALPFCCSHVDNSGVCCDFKSVQL